MKIKRMNQNCGLKKIALGAPGENDARQAFQKVRKALGRVDFAPTHQKSVEVLCTTPHIYEQKDCTNNGYVMNMLEHNTMINIDTGVHMISYITQDLSTHTECRSLIHTVSHRGSSRLVRVTPYMHGHLCFVWWLFSSPISFSSPFRCSSSRPSRRPPPRSTRSSCPKTCATSAWGPWPVMTTRHPSQVMSPTGRRTSWTPKSSTSRLPATSTGSTPLTDTSRNDPDVDDDQLAMYLAGVVDSTGKPVAKRSKIGRFFLGHPKT